ncbi:MAG TPA: hypothetical protein VF767_11300 [Bryobacteraceae bacterium]
MLHFRVVCAAAFVLALAGCSSGPTRQPEIGEAYAGPAKLKLRKELDPRSAEVATVSHGERLGIVARRRRFVRVRTSSGGEGWTDMRQLLSSSQMAELNGLAEAAARMPSQGAATVYEALNVHTLPNRQAPSFYRVAAGEPVDLVAQELSQRVPLDSTEILPRPPAKVRPVKKQEETGIPKLPMPAPPKLPDNWLELSKSPVPPQTGPPEEPEPLKPVPVDDWSLIRLKNGRAGWVLTGSLKMNIPDEVAQYSEGHRITSYFITGDVQDDGQLKHHWLWTTLSKTKQPYQFDSFRYFIWNLRKHRYETAYVERNLKGYFPVEVVHAGAAAGKGTESFPSFRLIVEEDGVRYRKTYSYQVYLVRLVSKERIEAAGTAPVQNANAAVAQANPAAQQTGDGHGLFTKLKRSLASLRARWFGKPKSPAR